jgi:extradiol dioxygenase family protein
MRLVVKDLAAWQHFAADMVGLELSEEGERDRCSLRMDYWHHRLVLHNDSSDDLLYLGFRVAGAEEFAAMQQQLAEAGIKKDHQTEPLSQSKDQAQERRLFRPETPILDG